MLTLLSFGLCEKHCMDSCGMLNGNIEIECGDCDGKKGYLCYPGAELFDGSWKKRNEEYRSSILQVRVDAIGKTEQDDDEVPIIRTNKAMEFRLNWYDIASKKRDENGMIKNENDKIRNFTSYEQKPLPVPQHSPRNCEVHSCTLIKGDENCIHNFENCSHPSGHLQKFGRQSKTILPVPIVSHIDAEEFWTNYAAKYKPVLLKDIMTSLTDMSKWSDDSLKSNCKLSNGQDWITIVEKNKRITHNDRLPFMDDINTFCDFITNYRKQEYEKMLYMITSMKNPHLELLNWIKVPEALRCSDFLNGIEDVRMWMSSGNTTSSVHFDTHDNLLMQLSGKKHVVLFHPNEGGNLYMDHHNKFGLSPINIDYVDLERFPEVKNAVSHQVTIDEGDALYIPDGWWHMIHSESRNIGITLEIEAIQDTWMNQTMLRRKSASGVYWAEQIAINGALRDKHRSRFLARSTQMPFKCKNVEYSITLRDHLLAHADMPKTKLPHRTS